MSKKRLYLFSTIGLIVLIWLTIPLSLTAALQRTPTHTPTRTPRITPTPRTETIRRSVLSNSVRGLGLNAPYDANLPPCQSADFGVNVWQDLRLIGTTADVTTLSRENGVMSRVTDSLFPAICSSDPIGSASATNLDTGETFNALLWDYDPTQVQNSSVFYEGDVPYFYVAQLPIDAYAHSGNWLLRIDSPQIVEVTISIAVPPVPSGLLDGAGGYLLTGFPPGERVVGLIFNDTSEDGVNVITEIKDDFEIITDNQGTGRYTSSTAYWDVVSPHLTVGLMLMVGNQGNGLIYPLGEFGTAIFTTDGGASPADFDADSQITAQELMEYVRRDYWSTSDSDTACSDSLPPRLIVGQLARVTPGDSNNLRASASQGSARIGSLSGGAEFTVLSGPVCNGGYLWWEVDYNGTTGWTAESGDGDYWLEPLNGATIATPAPLAGTFSRNLFLTEPNMTGDDVALVQSRLIDLGYDPGPIDGIYGPVTEATVIQYQRDNGLEPDGIVGPITWGSLFP